MILYCGIQPIDSYPGIYVPDAAQAEGRLRDRGWDIVVWSWTLGAPRLPDSVSWGRLILVSRSKTLALYEFAAAHSASILIPASGPPSLEQALAEAQAQLRTERQNESYRSLFTKYGSHLSIHLWHDLIVEGSYNDLLENKRCYLLLLEPLEDSPPQQLLEEPHGIDSRHIISEIFPEASVILALQAQWEGVVFDGHISHMEERAAALREALSIRIGAKRRVWLSPALLPEEVHGFYMDTLSEAVRRNAKQNTRTVSKLVADYIEAHLGERLTRKTISDNLFFSPDYLAKVFQTETGMTLGAFIFEARLERARELLKKTDRPIGAVALEVGHQNFAEFSQWFKKATGLTPSQYRKKAGSSAEPTGRDGRGKQQ